jgi:hypothetical protein
MRPRCLARPSQVPCALLWLVLLTAAAPLAAVPDGALDDDFAGDGVLGFYFADLARAAATLPDQSIAIVGDLETAIEPRVDWMKVTTFATTADCGAGVFSLTTFEGRVALVDRAGGLVIGGVATFSGAPSQQVALVARFGPSDCSSFSSGWSGAGWEVLDTESFCDTENCLLVDLVESWGESPRLYALLESRVNSLVSRFFVVAFAANGNLDTSFGADGYAEVTLPDLGQLAAGGAYLDILPSGNRSSSAPATTPTSDWMPTCSCSASRAMRRRRPTT